MPPVQENKWELCSRDYAQAGSVAIGTDTPAYPVSNLIDGTSLSGWRLTGSLPAALTFDLKAARQVDRVFVRCPFGYGVGVRAIVEGETVLTGVELEMSMNGSDWEDLPFTAYGDTRVLLLRHLPVTYRYLRMTVTTLPAGVPALRIADVSIFKSQFVCDGFTSSMAKKMPWNPQTLGRSFAGSVLVPLMHGTNHRVQTWGGDRKVLAVGFPAAPWEFGELLEFYKDRGSAFGIVTHEYVFYNVIIVPGSLQVNEMATERRGALEIDRSRTWYSVEVQVQEVSSQEAVTEEEPVAQEEEIIMTEIIEVP